jgi:hypothetical protein
MKLLIKPCSERKINQYSPKINQQMAANPFRRIKKKYDLAFVTPCDLEAAKPKSE